MTLEQVYMREMVLPAYDKNGNYDGRYVLWLEKRCAMLQEKVESVPALTNTGRPKLPQDVLESFKRQSDALKGVTHMPSFVAGAISYHNYLERQPWADA